MKLIIDIECDGFAPSRLHSLVMVDADTAEVFSCCAHPDYAAIADGLPLLPHAAQVIGHGIIAFDLRIIKKLHGIEVRRERVYDTLVASRTLWPDQRESDKSVPDMPIRLHNKHSLEAWGWRLGQRKTDFGTDFRFWSKQMQDYCEDDVITPAALWLHIEREHAVRHAAL